MNGTARFLDSLTTSIPSGAYALLILISAIATFIIIRIFHFHLKKYTFNHTKTWLTKIVFVIGALILFIIMMVSLGIII
ncbi:hypothetical protein CL684_01340 [Candidatus Campbellbacteria bacterium]|nr:hypothetical protein [Candidatus Campbellbacteria bacterium]|tara:strand:+ start:2130 stop:2366 length:237 start_codon:yes stop_codon:yes gene_type:complete